MVNIIFQVSYKDNVFNNNFYLYSFFNFVFIFMVRMYIYGYQKYKENCFFNFVIILNNKYFENF